MPSKPIPKLHAKRLENLGVFVRELRNIENLTQYELSQEINVARKTIQNVESGQNITLLTLCEIAEGFNLTPSQLLEDL